VQQAVHRQVFMGKRQWVVGDKPHRLDVVFVIFVQPRRRLLEMAARSVELAARNAHYA
jgi:hypothetical protein